MKHARTQADAVAEVMRNLGGYATLADLYLQVPTQTWKTKTPFATIRRILQTDPQKRFFRIRPGLWGLTEERDRVLRQLGISERKSPEALKAFDHTYYQGLVLEIGSLRGYPVFAPKQDRNKRFLKGKLRDLVTLDDVPPFTYEKLRKRARTVDVIWFHSQDENRELLFPYAFFEIEHTTDFKNSLIKFAEFQNFKIRFFVVASAEREREFQDCLNRAAFKEIRNQVKFVDYSSLEDLYQKAVLEQRLGI